MASIAARVSLPSHPSWPPSPESSPSHSSWSPLAAADAIDDSRPSCTKADDEAGLKERLKSMLKSSSWFKAHLKPFNFLKGTSVDVSSPKLSTRKRRPSSVASNILAPKAAVATVAESEEALADSRSSQQVICIT